jgi:F-type H+-transporting ATPase subunit delta
MRSASRQAAAELTARQDSALGSASADALIAAADECYAVAALLVGQPRLRRTLGDPATEPQSRAGLAGELLGGKVSAPVLDIVQAAVSARWSSPWDLCDALESAGDDALFSAAEKDGSLSEVEDELFRLERTLDAESDLATLLDEQGAPAARRVGLLDRLVAAKVSPITLALLRHALSSERKRSLSLAIDDLLERSAARQERSVARVVSATPLTEQQEARLAAALGSMYGRAIVVRSATDPAVRGGLVVRIGDEVIDGTVASRLAQARNALAG